MDRHTRGLIDNDQVLVLEDDGEGYLLRLRRSRRRRRDADFQCLVSVEAIAGLLSGLTELRHHPVLDQAVSEGTRDVAESRDGNVQPLTGQVGGYLQDGLTRQTGTPDRICLH
jgi:hypothetical protein